MYQTFYDLAKPNPRGVGTDKRAQDEEVNDEPKQEGGEEELSQA